MAAQGKKIAVLANILRREGQQIAKDVAVEFTIPQFVRGEFSNAGTDETPLFIFDGVMEAKITGKGVDGRMVDIASPYSARYKLSEVQQANNVEGDAELDQVQIVFKGKGAGLPSHGSTVGEGYEPEYTIILSRYEQYLNGEELVLIDRDLNICRIHGKDYFQEINDKLN